MAARRSIRAAVLILLALFLVSAVAFWFLNRPPTTPSILRAVAFADLDGWSRSDPRPARDAFERSCARLLAMPATETLTGTGYGGTAGDWNGVCHQVPQTNDAGEVRRWFEAAFQPVLVGGPEALFTGYYEPELKGSRRAIGAYRTPVYGRPDDLIDVELGAFRAVLKGERIAGRVEEHRLVPYFTRAEIDRFGLPHAPILFFADDPAKVFFLHIQGSGRVRLENGTVERVAYDGQNGLPYTPIGRVLIAEGQIARADMSMQAIRNWIDSHPAESTRVIEKDQSFVFFKELPLGDPRLGSPGAEGVPLTPGGSIAVDERVNALGAPYFVVADSPDPDPIRPDRPLRQLFVAQDVGGAIRGAARADLFFGYGPAAESMAGRMKSHGRLYVLLPRALANRVLPATS